MLTKSMKKRFTALIDPEYIREREALIPEAEAFADKQFGRKGPGGNNIKANVEYARKWSGCFMAKLDRLYRERKQSKS